MHAQIKAIIASIRPATDGRVSVTLTSGERTPMGRVLYDLYYNTNLADLLSREERFGYPHNGGEHTLQLLCKPLDAIAFIEQVKETLQDKRTYDEEHRQLISELSFISQELSLFRRQQRSLSL